MKNFTSIKNLMKNWFISYDHYTDVFQIYDDLVFSIPKRKLIERKRDQFRLLIDKQSNRPLMFEVENVYNIFSVDIDRLSKSAIIKLVSPYFIKLSSEYAKANYE